MHLTTYDISFCLRRMPRELKKLMEKESTKIVVAGGFIRSVIAGEPIPDIDIFAGNKQTSENLALSLAGTPRYLYATDNAITVKCFSLPLQFIYRWIYDNPLDILKSFDFSICQAAIWYDKTEKKWSSTCSERFYQDLAAKRLVYLSPIRNEDAGGSLLRVLKYYQRGYRLPLDSFGAVLARLFTTIKWDSVMAELDIAKLITGLLVEVDPAGFIDHEAYLPPETENLKQKKE